MDFKQRKFFDDRLRVVMTDGGKNMERHFFSKPFVNLFSVVVGGAAVILALSRIPAERIIPAPAPENHSVTINVEESPTPRSDAIRSYSEAVRRAAPCVVNVYSSKTVTESAETSLLNDPILKHFFGDHLFGSPESRDDKPHRTQSLGSGVICTRD